MYMYNTKLNLITKFTGFTLNVPHLKTSRKEWKHIFTRHYLCSVELQLLIVCRWPRRGSRIFILMGIQIFYPSSIIPCFLSVTLTLSRLVIGYLEDFCSQFCDKLFYTHGTHHISEGHETYSVFKNGFSLQNSYPSTLARTSNTSI